MCIVDNFLCLQLLQQYIAHPMAHFPDVGFAMQLTANSEVVGWTLICGHNADTDLPLLSRNSQHRHECS